MDNLHNNYHFSYSKTHQQKPFPLKSPPLINHEPIYLATKHNKLNLKQKNKKSAEFYYPPGLQQDQLIHDSIGGVQKLLKLKLQVSEYNTQDIQIGHSLHNKLINVKKFHSKVNRKETQKQKTKIKSKNKQISIKSATNDDDDKGIKIKFGKINPCLKSATKNLESLASCKLHSKLFTTSEYDSIYFQQNQLINNNTKEPSSYNLNLGQRQSIQQLQQLQKYQQSQIQNKKIVLHQQIGRRKSKSLASLHPINNQMKIKVILKINKKLQAKSHQDKKQQKFKQLRNKLNGNFTTQEKDITLQQASCLELTCRCCQTSLQRPKQHNFRIKKTNKNHKSSKKLNKINADNSQNIQSDIIPINAWSEDQTSNILSTNCQRYGRVYQQNKEQVQLLQFIQLAANQS